MDLISSPRASQPFQFRNALPSPTTHIGSHKFLNWNNYLLPINHNWRNPAITLVWMLTPSHTCKLSQGAWNHTLLCRSPPPLPVHIHSPDSYIHFTCYINPYVQLIDPQAPSWPSLLFYIRELSITWKDQLIITDPTNAKVMRICWPVSAKWRRDQI